MDPIRMCSGCRGILALSIILMGYLPAVIPAGAEEGFDRTQYGKEVKMEFIDQVSRGAKPAEEYVVSKFEGHDVVWVGEAPHNVRQNLEFLKGLIPELYAAGVYSIGYEMGLAIDQSRLDDLINSSRYDQSLADELIFRWRPLDYSYQDYGDVYRAAWELNQKLPPHARKFRILLLDISTHPTEHSQLAVGKDGHADRRAMERLLGGNWNDRRDMQWAEIIVREVLQKNEKLLVYSGAGHSATRLQKEKSQDQPHWRAAAQLIQNYIGERIFRISLGGEPEFDLAAIDSLMSAFTSATGRNRVGFDVIPGTVIGDMRTSHRGYLPPSVKFGAARSGDFTISHVTDGYVYLLPRTQFKMVRQIELTPELVREYNRLMQIKHGDPRLHYTYEKVEKMYRQEHERYRGLVELKAVP